MIKNILRILKNANLVADELAPKPDSNSINEKNNRIGKIVLADFDRVEGSVPNHILVEAALVKIGGGGWKGEEFKLKILKHFGYDLNIQQIEDDDKIFAYNCCARILNKPSVIGKKLKLLILTKFI